MKNRKIWIDLDNSPHVLFFDPIIKELKDRAFNVTLTTRDCSQTCGLADLHSLEYKRIGKHYGKNKVFKLLGTFYRAIQLTQHLSGKGMDLAVSHGSRAQTLAAKFLNIPSLVIFDYEFTKGNMKPTWVMTPDIVSNSMKKSNQKGRLSYPGIKEDVYVPFFRPSKGFKEDLDIKEGSIVVTIRPPATEAHYHNPESEGLFDAAVNRLKQLDQVVMVILPRYDKQKEIIESSWPELILSKKILIPEKVVDGLNLLWISDLVISGGGTMNREAAALGVPVYSIFRGKIGAVDHWLEKQGRLTLMEGIEDIHNKIKVEKRQINSTTEVKPSKALSAIIDHIENIINSNR